MYKMFRKILIGILISITLFNTGAFAYEDIPQSSPYFYAIEYLRRNDVFATKKLFRPNLIISKAEYIKYLALLNSPDMNKTKKVNLPFIDTQNNAWYAPYFDEAIKLGILDTRDTKVQPYKKLSVYEALELLFHSRNIPIPRKHIGYIPYTDVERNTQSQALVMRAIELGIVEPDSPDKFGLYRRITRAKAARMIYKMDLVDLRSGPVVQTSSVSFEPELEKFINAWELVTGNFVDNANIDLGALSDAAIKAMVEGLDDPYSVFMDEEQNSAFSDELDGELEGIGAFVAISDEGEISIVAPITGSPADKAGIRAGDIIVKVDDFDTEGQTLYETVNRIKGPKGTTVKLRINRRGQILTISVVRDVISIDPIEYEVIGRGDIMYIKIVSFNQKAADDFQDVVDIISNNPNIKGIVLDLRNNPGGLLGVSIKMLDNLLPNDSIAVHVQYNFFNYVQKTSGEGTLSDYPMAVLVNKGSASASEIVAGALKDHGVATLIGETTFGKGTVQEVNYFSDSSSLKITVAEWLTPDMNSIDKNGVSPNIEVEEVDGADKPLDKAVEIILNAIR